MGVAKQYILGGLYMSNVQEIFDRFDMVMKRIDKLEGNMNILLEDTSKKYDLTSVMKGLNTINGNIRVLANLVEGLKTSDAVNKADILVEIDKLNKSLNTINDAVYELTKESEEDKPKKVYTDTEIFELKKELSWSQMVKYTGMPRSTLIWHYNRYKEAHGII
jgi:predicted  nucleic acid-binding Zn-ribbon protein